MGYLRGHLTPAIAELESGDAPPVEAQVYANASQSSESDGAGELSPRDQALVKSDVGTPFDKANNNRQGRKATLAFRY